MLNSLYILNSNFVYVPDSCDKNWSSSRAPGGWARLTAGSGRVSGSVVHVSKQQAGNATEGGGGGESRDRRPDAGYGRQEARRRTRTHDPPTSRAVGTFDVCSNAAVNSGLSCFLYTL